MQYNLIYMNMFSFNVRANRETALHVLYRANDFQQKCTQTIQPNALHICFQHIYTLSCSTYMLSWNKKFCMKQKFFVSHSYTGIDIHVSCFHFTFIPMLEVAMRHWYFRISTLISAGVIKRTLTKYATWKTRPCSQTMWLQNMQRSLILWRPL